MRRSGIWLFLQLTAVVGVIWALAPTNAKATIIAATHTATAGLNDAAPPVTPPYAPVVPASPEIVLGGLGVGARPIRDRTTTILPALYDSNVNPGASPPTPRIALGVAGGTVSTLAFPSYLNGADFVRVNQNNRNATGYELTITVDTASQAYLLLDNRNGTTEANGGTKYQTGPFAFYDSYFEPDVNVPASPVYWVSQNGWTRVNTGVTPAGLPDYVGIDEGPNGDLNQFYAVFTKTVGPGSFKTFGQVGNNFYTVAVVAIPEPTTTMLLLFGAATMAVCRSKPAKS